MRTLPPSSDKDFCQAESRVAEGARSDRRLGFGFMKRQEESLRYFLGGCPRLVIVTRLCRFEADFSIV